MTTVAIGRPPDQNRDTAVSVDDLDLHPSATRLPRTLSLRCDAGPTVLHLSLASHRSGVRLGLTGDLDFAVAPRLDLVLRRLERLPRAVTVDLGRVRFADATGLSPLMDSALRRDLDDLPPLLVSTLGRAAARVTALLPDDPGCRALLAGYRGAG